MLSPAGRPHSSQGDPSETPNCNRRHFLVQAGAIVATIAVSGCSVGGIGGPSSVHLSLNIGDYPELADVGGVAYVSANGAPLAVIRTAADSFLALSRVCPHMGGQINSVSSGFRCTLHGAQFDRSGHWQGGQPTSNMRSYPTSFDAVAGVLTIG